MGRSGPPCQAGAFLVDDAGHVCCEAVFTVGLLDLAARKLISPTQ
jgi:hypothetical protein